MRRALTPSFIVTLSVTALGACNRSEPATTTASSTSTASSISTSTSTPTPSAKATRKRRRTRPFAPDTSSRTASRPNYADLVAQNPIVEGKGTVYVSGDDSCYVEVPMKPPYPPMPTGMRAVTEESVDCPADVDDPAWDECAGSTLSANLKKAGDCYCIPISGNPPPPPTQNACPAKLKK